MRALSFDGKLHFTKDAPKPVPAGDEALIRVLYAGICNTDLEIIRGYSDFTGIMGHEFVGLVEESADASLVGKRVVGNINLSCQQCMMCFAGRPNHCLNRTVLGIVDKDGTFADFVTLPNRNLYPVPDSIDDQTAVFVEPLAAAYRTDERIDIDPHWDIVVLGDGKLGLLAAQILKTHGANPLVAGKHEEKMNIVRKMGIKAMISDLVPVNSAHMVVECTGKIEGFKQALSIVRPEGTVVLKSTVADVAEINLAPIVINEITIVGSRCGTFPTALSALKSKIIDVKSMITAVYDFDDAIEALERAQHPDAIKVLLKMSGD